MLWSLQSSFPRIFSFADHNMPHTALSTLFSTQGRSPLPRASSGSSEQTLHSTVFKRSLCSCLCSANFLFPLAYRNLIWHLRTSSKYYFPWKHLLWESTWSNFTFFRTMTINVHARHFITVMICVSLICSHYSSFEIAYYFKFFPSGLTFLTKLQISWNQIWEPE